MLQPFAKDKLHPGRRQDLHLGLDRDTFPSFLVILIAKEKYFFHSLVLVCLLFSIISKKGLGRAETSKNLGGRHLLEMVDFRRNS